MALAQGPLGDETRETEGEVETSREDHKYLGKNVKNESVRVSATVPKCLLVPLRNLCMPSLRLELDSLFPLLPGTFPEEHYLGSNVIESETNKTNKCTDAKPCFAVCSII